MKFHEFGNKENPHIMLIHGGGNAWWNYLRQAKSLSDRYYVILPTLDGHGEEYCTEYISTEDTANKLMNYIEENSGGKLFALCAVSLGGQIVIELLSRKIDIAKKAIIDGSVCYPTPRLAKICSFAVKVFGGLIFSKLACKWSIILMEKFFPKKMIYPKEIQSLYIKDMPKLKNETLYSIYKTYMNYSLKNSLRDSDADVMYIYGDKEMKVVKKSAQIFKDSVKSCEIYEAKGYNHGYLSIYLPDEWLTLAEDFFQRDIKKSS